MIFLSFDIEEFDNPLPYSKTLSFEQQMSMSEIGTARILDLLKQKNVRATFFCTANFAIHANGLIERMVSEGHEVASHGYYHAKFEIKDLKESKDVLERLTGKTVYGFRMANMMPVDAYPVIEAGYQYNSSLNPTFLPGKYNNLSKPRRIFREGTLCQIPASVSSILRIPLFWLSLHNFPISIYKSMCIRTIKKDGYLNIYFHSWELAELRASEIKLPSYIVRNSGKALAERLSSLIDFFKQKEYPFSTLKECRNLFL